MALAEVFMHPKLSCLAFTIPSDPLGCAAMFDNVKHRLCNLTTITIWPGAEAAAGLMEAEFSRLIPCLHRLHTVSLPYLTTPLVRALLKLANLKSIEKCYYSNVGSFGKKFEVNATLTFTRLTLFNQKGRFEDIIRLLMYAPKLKRFRILAWLTELHHTYGVLLFCLSMTHPRLRELDIDNIPHSWTFRNKQTIEDTRRFSKLVFSQIATFTGLTTLRLAMVNPLPFTRDNVRKLLSSLPYLEVLYLNCSHVVLRDDSPSASSIHILSDFAMLCSRLTELGLFVDCRNLPLLVNKPEHTLNLTRLNLGVSHIGPNYLHLAHYLSFHCLPHCDFESGSILWPKVIENRIIAEYGTDYRVNRWDGERENVMKVFNVFVKLQEQYEREKRAITRTAAISE